MLVTFLYILRYSDKFSCVLVFLLISCFLVAILAQVRAPARSNNGPSPVHHHQHLPAITSLAGQHGGRQQARVHGGVLGRQQARVHKHTRYIRVSLFRESISMRTAHQPLATSNIHEGHIKPKHLFASCCCCVVPPLSHSSFAYDPHE